ncbi:hypothetical protein L4G92_07840 [Neisseria sp. ZJ106]|uniref:Uncharacterized protein n=1 Tax=Neisseria lisongii TaxID=2912188 RepID=A0ABY7RJF8_9NEIS|nr:hypothetical protein [Neisseria lisongii]MCF7521954.1 hypothetical protein [Neisseria lisongii]WCL70911.1 hypothetical protein PJU73_05985 [Neisseria lisongii]
MKRRIIHDHHTVIRKLRYQQLFYPSIKYPAVDTAVKQTDRKQPSAIYSESTKFPAHSKPNMPVIPTKVGIYFSGLGNCFFFTVSESDRWIPTFVGMTGVSENCMDF